MKTIVLLALGIVATDGKKHKHQHKHLNPKVLQSEIENLREQYDALNHKYDKLQDVVKGIETSQTQVNMAQRSAPKHAFKSHQGLQSMVQRQRQRPHQPIQSIVQIGEEPPKGPKPNMYGLAADAEGKPIPGSPAMPSPQPFVRGEKQWMDNGQNINDWGDKQMTVANERIPYWSTVQLESQADATPNLYGLATDKKGNPVPGGPAFPSPQPFVRGEKQWMDNAANINVWGDTQMTAANTRIPYMSTFVQLGEEPKGPLPNMYGLASDKEGKPIPGAPAYPSPQPFVRGEKQWMDNGQNINDWGDKQMTVANERIPYQSSLLQTEDPKPNLYGNAVTAKGKPIPGAPAMPSPQPFVRGEKQWMDNGQNINDWGDQQMTVANERIPYWSTLVQTEESAAPNLYGLAIGKDKKPVAGSPAMPSPQPFVRGEKQWMDNAANINVWGDTQMTAANTRIPYMSTFTQLKDDDPSKMESMIMEDMNIPLNMRFMQTMQDDDPNNMESMVMEDLDLPLNARLVHVQTQDGNELIRIVGN